MPFYEYECEGCGNRFEMLVNKSTEVCCPECGVDRVEKKLSIFATAGSSKSDGGPAADLPACPTCQMPGGTCGLN